MLTYNAVLSDRWTGNPEPPGRQVEIDGYSLYVTDTGAGSSTIVILHDVLSFSPEWWGIQKELSSTARVISYDRPGYGWSQRRSGPRDSAHAVEELEEVLAHLNVRGACVLIGHGLGGLYAQHFAFTHPDRVSAVILVDPITVNHGRFKEELRSAVYQNIVNKSPYIKVLRAISFSGLIRSLNMVPRSIDGDPLRRVLRNHYSLHASYAAMDDEYTEGLGTSIAQVRKSRRTLAAPIIVIGPSRAETSRFYMTFGLSLDEADKIASISEDLMKETASYSATGRVVESGSGDHNLHIHDPSLIVGNAMRALESGPHRLYASH